MALRKKKASDSYQQPRETNLPVDWYWQFVHPFLAMEMPQQDFVLALLDATRFRHRRDELAEQGTTDPDEVATLRERLVDAEDTLRTAASALLTSLPQGDERGERDTTSERDWSCHEELLLALCWLDDEL